MKISKIFTLVALLGALNTFGQRTIIWVHGVGENASFWETQANNFTDRAENRRRYGQAQIRPSFFASEIRNNSTANARNIAVGHNMGGVALRELDHANPNHVGGVITFGAPLDGAPLIGAIQSREVDQVLGGVSEILDRGPNAGTVGIFDWLFSIGFSSQGRERYFQTIYGHIILNIFGGGDLDFEGALDFSQAAFLNDLTVDGDYMETARTYESNIPKIVVYGDEDGPVHVRLASSADSNGENDTAFLSGYNEVTDTYYSQAEAWEPATVCIINCKKKRAISRAWRDGYEYLESGFEEDWNYLIGSYRYEYRTYDTWVNICDDMNENGDMYRTEMTPSLQTRSECYEKRTYTTRVKVMEESDGLLPKSSAVGELSQWTKQDTEVVRAPGVNSLEMGEHAESRRILNEAFNGVLYNPFFRNVE